MNNYQFLVEVPEGTDFQQLPPAFHGLSELMELEHISHQRMPGTRAHNSRALIHMVSRNVSAMYAVVNLLTAGISAAIGQSWVVVAAQDLFESPQFDSNGDPIMIASVDEDGNPIQIQKVAPSVDKALSESYFLDFMDDVVTYDEDGNETSRTRPTVATPHKMLGAADWVMAP